jgi:uncharacterized membrane protein YccC
MATAYIVAQPMTGTMRSKAAYRFAGTFIGALVTLVLVPNLVDAPEVLVAALALWTGFCIYFAVLDRTPRSYLFLLGGYTVALIGFPAVAAPGQIWDIVLARVEEITLGIGCTTLLGTLILPAPLGPVLARRIDALLDQAAAATLAALSGLPDTPVTRGARRQLAADAVEIAGLSSHLAYDTSSFQQSAPAVNVLYHRVVLLLAVLSGITDRTSALREGGGLTADLCGALDAAAAWMQARGSLATQAPALRAAIAALEPAEGSVLDWNGVLRVGLLRRLAELVDIGHDVSLLRRHIDAGRSGLPALTLPARDGTPRHRDHFMAAYSAAAAVLTLVLVCAYWIGAAWPEGASAAGLVAVACSFFAAQDDPVPSIVRFLYGAIIALVVDAAYLFAILPLAHDFEMLALALAALYVPLGLLMAQPRTAPVGGPIAFMSATLMTLTTSYTADFAAYANGAAASIVGLAATAVVLRLVRSMGASFMAQRLLRLNRATIAAAASRSGAGDRLAFAALMLDRLGEVVPRLASAAEGADLAAAAALAEIRVGINVVDLQHAAAACAAEPKAALHAVLDGVALHFRGDGTPRAALLAQIDAAIELCAALPSAQGRDMLLALGGIRRSLFRDAPPYTPTPAAPPALKMAA